MHGYMFLKQFRNETGGSWACSYMVSGVDFGMGTAKEDFQSRVTSPEEIEDVAAGTSYTKSNGF